MQARQVNGIGARDNRHDRYFLGKVLAYASLWEKFKRHPSIIYPESLLLLICSCKYWHNLLVNYDKTMAGKMHDLKLLAVHKTTNSNSQMKISLMLLIPYMCIASIHISRVTQARRPSNCGGVCAFGEAANRCSTEFRSFQVIQNLILR